MKHSQIYRGRTVIVHAEHRDRGYSWRFVVQDLPCITGCGMTLCEGRAQENALREAMRAARLAIDRAYGRTRGDGVPFFGDPRSAAGASHSPPDAILVG